MREDVHHWRLEEASVYFRVQCRVLYGPLVCQIRKEVGRSNSVGVKPAWPCQERRWRRAACPLLLGIADKIGLIILRRNDYSANVSTFEFMPKVATCSQHPLQTINGQAHAIVAFGRKAKLKAWGQI